MEEFIRDLRGIMGTLIHCKGTIHGAFYNVYPQVSIFHGFVVCGRDINEILNPWEKNGGIPRNMEAMYAFKQAINYCELTDKDRRASCLLG